MRICALGAYGRRHGWPGFPWDGQYRAWKALGHDVMHVDIRGEGKNYEDLRDRLLAFAPELVWIDLKDGLPFLIRLVGDVGVRTFRTLYWFRDLRAPEGVSTPVPIKPPRVDPEKVWGLIDCLFLVAGGELLHQHQQAYKVPRACFMPMFCVPEVSYRRDVPQVHDIVFTGGMDGSLWHRGRTRLIKRMSKRYSVRVRNNAIVDLAEFNSSGKIVFGAGVVGEEPAFQPLYCTSVRFWLALACGACYVCQWFPGIDRLVRNHEHLVWWKDERELYQVLDYYLAHDEERERIGRNAQALAHDKHTHVERIQNILDFVEGKVDSFRGFID